VVPFVTDAFMVLAAVARSSYDPSVCMTDGPTDWAWRGCIGADGMLAFRLIFLLVEVGAGMIGEADPLATVGFFVINGRLSIREEKLFLVSSFMSLVNSEVRSY